MLVLDPNVKDMYFRSQWSRENYNAGMRQLEEVVSCSMPICHVRHTDDFYISLIAISLHPHQLLRQQRTLHQVHWVTGRRAVHKLVRAANTFTDGPSATQPSLHYGGSYLMTAVQAIQIQQQADTADGPRDELQKYLKSGAESTTDIVSWWGVSLLSLSVHTS